MMLHTTAMLEGSPQLLSKTFSDHEIYPLSTKDPQMMESLQILLENLFYQ